ncbi:tyrosine-type recombinase/integrase [Stenotrophobium rhamnosiphilum]|uniref:Tyr recombinase domain-containing protein n=1 Tax=Stenotrophobium rhamnosiphilum TaxID=2029166 RepID=A0A2T5MEE6_9GAMM|nr:site-specific integrase [Stenotrophobium rhamnosiphilum]PTU30954.1 hypothetical protein CJD38_11650 [Stenotrophobium rhamnosiphilum]
MPTLKLSEQSVKSLLPLVGKDTFYYDSELTGFGVKVAASGSRSYFIETRIQKGRPAKRKKLGGCDRMKASEAREQARRDLAQMVMGFDPVSQRKDVEKAKVTLRTALEGRIESRSLKPKTAYDYRQIGARALGDWMDRPLSTITEQMAVDRHSELALKNGPAYSNLAMRILSAAHGHAVGVSGLQSTNPVARLRKGQLFKKVKGRTTYIKEAHLRVMLLKLRKMEEANALDYVGSADMIRVFLLTGFRLNEVQGLRWDQVDIKGKTITLGEAATKNGKVLVMPCCEALMLLLAKRKRSATTEWVFPNKGGTGHYTNLGRWDIPALSKAVAEALPEVKGWDFSAHDLRRTFATYLRSMGQPELVIAGLLNHSKQSVTQGYALSVTSALHRLLNEYQAFLEALLTPPKQRGGFIGPNRGSRSLELLSGVEQPYTSRA